MGAAPKQVTRSEGFPAPPVPRAMSKSRHGGARPGCPQRGKRDFKLKTMDSGHKKRGGNYGLKCPKLVASVFFGSYSALFKYLGTKFE